VLTVRSIEELGLGAGGGRDDLGLVDKHRECVLRRVCEHGGVLAAALERDLLRLGRGVLGREVARERGPEVVAGRGLEGLSGGLGGLRGNRNSAARPRGGEVVGLANGGVLESAGNEAGRKW